MHDILNKHFEEGLGILKDAFVNHKIRYFEIPEVDISKFTIPEINSLGNFVAGPQGYREEYQELIQSKLSMVKNPSLYFFELIHPETTLVHETFLRFSNFQKKKTGPDKRNCSAVNRILNPLASQIGSNILYVGKSEKPINGRIVVHFGYYEKSIAGLQLIFWGAEINLKVKIHILEFVDLGMKPYMEVYEKIFIKQLRPIIGIK